MPAEPVSINLFENANEQSPVDRIVNWAVTYGRYIMIATEIVVLLAFISRFSLDRKLTDLKEEITQKQAILEANVSLEDDIHSLQDRLGKIKTLLAQQNQPLDLTKTVLSLVPPDVYLTTLTLNKDTVTIQATAGTTLGFAQLLTNIKSTKQLTQVEIADIKKRPPYGIEFQISAHLATTKKK